jgi:hypothetical protein
LSFDFLGPRRRASKISSLKRMRNI